MDILIDFHKRYLIKYILDYPIIAASAINHLLDDGESSITDYVIRNYTPTPSDDAATLSLLCMESEQVPDEMMCRVSDKLSSLHMHLDPCEQPECIGLRQVGENTIAFRFTKNKAVSY